MGSIEVKYWRGNRWNWIEGRKLEYRPWIGWSLAELCIHGFDGNFLYKDKQQCREVPEKLTRY